MINIAAMHRCVYWEMRAHHPKNVLAAKAHNAFGSLNGPCFVYPVYLQNQS